MSILLHMAGARWPTCPISLFPNVLKLSILRKLLFASWRALCFLSLMCPFLWLEKRKGRGFLGVFTSSLPESQHSSSTFHSSPTVGTFGLVSRETHVTDIISLNWLYLRNLTPFVAQECLEALETQSHVRLGSLVNPQYFCTMPSVEWMLRVKFITDKCHLDD